MSSRGKRVDAPGFTPLTLAVREQIGHRPLQTFEFGARSLSVIAAKDALWIVIRVKARADWRFAPCRLRRRRLP